MEYQRITNLLGSIIDKVPKVSTKKWVKVYDQSGGTYSTIKQIKHKASMLRSLLCDYSNACILKNNAPFTSFISKIIEDLEDLDIAMRMYNLIESSKNYRKTTGSLWNCYRDEPTNPQSNSESFKYKSSIKEKIDAA